MITTTNHPDFNEATIINLLVDEISTEISNDTKAKIVIALMEKKLINPQFLDNTKKRLELDEKKFYDNLALDELKKKLNYIFEFDEKMNLSGIINNDWEKILEIPTIKWNESYNRFHISYGKDLQYIENSNYLMQMAKYPYNNILERYQKWKFTIIHVTSPNIECEIDLNNLDQSQQNIDKMIEKINNYKNK